jgi:hypothetical protein
MGGGACRDRRSQYFIDKRLGRKVVISGGYTVNIFTGLVVQFLLRFSRRTMEALSGNVCSFAYRVEASPESITGIGDDLHWTIFLEHDASGRAELHTIVYL